MSTAIVWAVVGVVVGVTVYRRIVWSPPEPLLDRRLRQWFPAEYAQREDARRRACLDHDERVA